MSILELMDRASSFPDLDGWNAWRPKHLALRLQALEVPWAVAAGWAIDLFVGHESRAHEDLEIVVARTSFDAGTTTFSAAPGARGSHGWRCR